MGECCAKNGGTAVPPPVQLIEDIVQVPEAALRRLQILVEALLPKQRLQAARSIAKELLKWEVLGDGSSRLAPPGLDGDSPPELLHAGLHVVLKETSCRLAGVAHVTSSLAVQDGARVT
jgi:hypothetical protein